MAALIDVRPEALEEAIQVMLKDGRLEKKLDKYMIR